MKAPEKWEVFAWCQHRSIKATDNGHLYFDTHERRCATIELLEKPYQLVALANALLPYTQAASFQGALLWIRRWGVWNELVEKVGFRVMELMRCFHGERRTVGEAPGLLFDSQELVDLQVCFIQALLVGWDAFLVPESGHYIVATSQDETICVLGRTPQIHQRVLAELQPWNPREDREWVLQGDRNS